MRRVAISEQTKSLLAAAKRIARDAEAEAVLVLADAPHDFEAFRDTLKRTRFIVASDKDDVIRAAEADGVDRVRILHEPQTRQHQLSQALLEAISESLLESGDRVVCLYPLFERDGPDSISLVNLAVHLARLSSRDLRRLDTSVPAGNAVHRGRRRRRDRRAGPRGEEGGGDLRGGGPPQGAGDVARAGARPVQGVRPQGTADAQPAGARSRSRRSPRWTGRS